ncbi:flavoprotein-like protein [Baffinella frigidus]|nr:flavoprotein-like protein [Cryptophyta sp. CCMP2293]
MSLLDWVNTRLNVLTSHWQIVPTLSEKKRVLLVSCHPLADSFGSACARAVESGLVAAGHEVRHKSLYEKEGVASYRGANFPPALTARERKGYHEIAASDGSKGGTELAPEVAEAVADLRWAQALVLVYPTWWMNVPGTLKGFIDRTFLPHVAFRLTTQATAGDGGVTGTGLLPLLTNIERVGVVTTYGASRLIVAGAGDNGRQMIGYALRPLFAPGCSLRWLGLYEMESTTEAQRRAYLARIEAAYRNF